MFGNILSEDIFREIISYDDTYKQLYKNIVKDAFNGEEVKALKKFLQGHIHFPLLDFGEWLSIKAFDYEGEKYYEIQYPTSTMVFHVMSLDRKKLFDNLEAENSPKIVENMLYKVPIQILQGFVTCTYDVLLRIKQAFTNPQAFNKVAKNLLKAKDYEDLVYHLQVHGLYEREMHDFLFQEMIGNRYHRDYDEEEQGDNYNYVTHDNEKMYMIMWYEF